MPFIDTKTEQLESEIEELKRRIALLEKSEPSYTFFTIEGYPVWPKCESIPLVDVIDLIIKHLKLEIKFNKATESSVELVKSKR